MEWANQARDPKVYYWQMGEAVAKHYRIDMEAPVAELPKQKLDLILYGTDDDQVPVRYNSRERRQATFRTAFEGVIGNRERRYQETQSEFIRSKIQEYMSERPCPACEGRRLRPEALAVTIDGLNIVEVDAFPVSRTLEW